MVKKPGKYPGDAAFDRFLDKYDCPLLLDVLKMRFLGAIASPDFGVSPLSVVRECWDGELPEFADETEAGAFFESVMSLWNRLARHQDGVRVKLTKPTRLRDWSDMSDMFHVRGSEIIDGFLHGFDDTPVSKVPEPLEEVRDTLEKIGILCHAECDRLMEFELGEADEEPDWEQCKALLADMTRTTEDLLTDLMKATKIYRGMLIEAESGQGPGTPH